MNLNLSRVKEFVPAEARRLHGARMVGDEVHYTGILTRPPRRAR